jgi:hypothetical protein
MMQWLENLFNKHMVVRRFTLLSTLIFTFFMYKLCYELAIASPKSGVDIATILAAILTPLTTFQGFVFNFYNQARMAANK